MSAGLKPIAAALIGLLYGCSTVCAATVSGPSGSVFVNRGSGFVPLAGDTELAPGGRVMVQPGAVAVITYGTACTVKVDSGRVWTIQGAAPCANGVGDIDFTGRMNQSGPGMLPEFTLDPLIVGALAAEGVLLIGCIAAWCTSSKSASP